jgi:hypothetical protein
MSLNYDLRTITEAGQEFLWRKGDPELREDPEADYMTSAGQGVIFATMAVGMGEITAQNYGKFYYRYRLFSQSIDGSDECWLKLEHVQAMIGLKTNVSLETDAKFHKRIMEKFCLHQRKLVAKEADALIEAGTIESRPTV